MFDRTNIYWPLEVVVRPENNTDYVQWDRIITELSAAHDQFLAIRGPDIDSILFGGCDERQLENNIILFRGELPCVLQMDPPQIGYRETVSQVAEADYSHRQPTSGGEQFAQVKLSVDPQHFKFDVQHLGDTGGFEFQNKAAGSAIPEKYISSIEMGIHVARNVGGINIKGSPIIGLKVSLEDGACHETVSSMMAFELASRTAFREAFQKASPVLLEPLITVDLITPEEYLGDIIGDLNSRRGSVTELDTLVNARTVKAIVPAANIFGFPNTLAHQTQDQASFSTQFSHYERVPSSPGSGSPWPEPGAAALSA